MERSLPQIKEVEIINSEIVITFSPLLPNEGLVIYENSPDPTEGELIGQILGPNNRMQIPFSQLSPYPVTDYYMVYFSGGVFEEKIENEDFNNALSFKVTLYDIDKINSSSNALTGHSTPGTLINLYSYNFLTEPSRIISKTITENNNTFSLNVEKRTSQYRPYHIEAYGKYHSPNQTIIVEKSPEDNDELINNGSFQNGINSWIQHPYREEEIDFTQKEGYGNFKLKEDIEGPLEAVQFISGPNRSRFRMTCEIRVHSFTNNPRHVLFLGQIVASGSPDVKHIRYDVSQEEIGTWISVSFENYFSVPWQFEKYGFTTDGIAEMDVRNVSMIEL